MNNKVAVKILGYEYNIVSDKNPEQIKNVARYVNNEMNKIKEGNSKLSSLATTIVACLNIADDLFDCCDENEQLHKELEELKNASLKQENENQQDINQVENQEKEATDAIEDENQQKTEDICTIEKLKEQIAIKDEEIEKYKSEIEALKRELEDANNRAVTAENMASQWQNKTYDLQLKYGKLENELKK